VSGNTYSIDGSTYLNNGGVFSGVVSGVYSVSVKNVSGCISSVSTVVVDAKPVGPSAPSLSVVQPTCELSTGTISVSSPINVGNGYSINGVDYSNTTGVFTGIVAGTYNVTVKNSSGCISPASVVVVNAHPLTPVVPTVEVSNPVCPDKTGSIRVVTPVGSGFTYSIDGSTYLNATGIFSSILPGAYSVSVKNGSGCVSSSVVVIVKDPVVNEPKLLITASGSTSICEGGSVVLTSSTAVSYQWYKYGVAIAGANNRTYTATTDGLYTVSRFSSDVSCKSLQSDGVEVKVASTPFPPVVNIVQPSCEISTATIAVISPISIGNTYSIDDINYINSTGVFTDLVPGTYKVTVKNKFGCISPGTIVKINNFPFTPQIPTVEVINPLCPDKTGTIRVKSPLGSGMSYSIDGVTYANGTGVFTGVVPGFYSVTAKNASGCVSAPVTVTVKDPSLDVKKLSITASSSTNICIGSTVVLTSSESNSYQWYKYGTAIAGANSKTFTASTEGVYTVSQISTNGCQVVQSDGIEIKVVARPVAPLLISDKLFFCEGDSATLNATSTNNIQWYRDGILLPNTGNKIVVKQGGTYAAISVNDGGCRSSFSQSIFVQMLDLPVTPVLTIKGSSKFCKNESRVLQVTIPSGLKITWFKNGSLIQGYALDTLRTNEAAEYTVKFESVSGCKSLVSNKIITEIGCVSTDIYIPDVFTPNGDGINDVIKPVCVGISKFSYFKIYNRWGNILFESSVESIGWDGKLRGQIQPADSYIWLVEGIDTNGKEIRKSGVLTLVR
jgi:gliding motility-associated-like protein